MKRISMTLCLTLVSGGWALADHHEGEALAKKLDALLEGVSQEDEASRYEPRMALRDLTSAASAPESPTRDAYVKLLLDRLQTEETSQAAQAWILRQLENVGRAESVPALVERMGSPFHHLRELARRALEQNPSAEAGAALRALAENEQDRNLKRALLHSLGQRGDTEAVAFLGQALTSKDPGLKHEAIIALGKVASDASIAALEEAYAAGADSHWVADALMESARRLTPDHADRAVAVLKKLYGYDEPPQVRAAALRGLLAARPGDADDLILLALQSEEKEVRRAAINACRGLEATSVMPNVLAVKLSEFEAEEQAMVLAVLGDSSDPTVASPLADTLEAGGLKDETLQHRVVEVLGQIGGIDAAARVLEMAVRIEDEAIREAASEALAEMPGEAVDAWLLSATRRGDVTARMVAARALGARRVSEAAEVLLGHAERGPKAMRNASLAALGDLAEVSDIARLLPYLDGDGDAAAKAIMAACRRAAVDSPSEGVEVILSAMESSSKEGQKKLLPCLGVLGGETALAAVERLLKDQALREVALRTLTGWSGPEAAPQYIRLAQSSDISDVERTLTLRGLVRLLSNDRNGMDGAERLRLAKEAMDAAKRVEDQRMFLPVLGRLGTPEALEALVILLEYEPLAEEAALALLSSVERMRGRGNRRQKQDLLKRVVRAEIEKETADRAREMLERMN